MKAKEKAVRDAAAVLSVAIAEARAAGFVVTWPSRSDGLDTIEISETGESHPTVAVTAPGTDPAVAAKAAAAAQKVVDKASDTK